MKYHGFTGIRLGGLSLTLIVSGFANAANAEELSAEEMVRRFELQEQTRSLSGQMPIDSSVPLAATPDISDSRGLRAYQGGEPLLNGEVIGTILESPTSLDGIPYTTETYEAMPLEAVDLTPIGTVPFIDEAVPFPLPLVENYQPVEDEARVDLRVFFEWNSASLKPEAIGQLATLCTAIQQVIGQRIFKLIGHTDKSGSDDYNLYLSEARAREVKRHLVEACGIPSDALIAVGEGERQANPNAPARDPSERRVEVQLVG